MVLGGESAAGEGAVYDDVFGFALGEEQLVFIERVAKEENGAAHGFDCGFEGEQVVVAGGLAVAAGGLNYGEDAVFFCLEGLVGEAELAQEFDATDLEPGEIVAVVDHTHLIGLGVPDSEARRKLHGCQCTLRGWLTRWRSRLLVTALREVRTGLAQLASESQAHLTESWRDVLDTDARIEAD